MHGFGLPPARSFDLPPWRDLKLPPWRGGDGMVVVVEEEAVVELR
jgi:hypothetical protein